MKTLNLLWFLIPPILTLLADAGRWPLRERVLARVARHQAA